MKFTELFCWNNLGIIIFQLFFGRVHDGSNATIWPKQLTPSALWIRFEWKLIINFIVVCRLPSECCRCVSPQYDLIEKWLFSFSASFRLFSSRRCARCGAGLSSSELVMRARELVFHVGCFCCILCGVHLSAGDTAAVRGGRVFCSEHYDADILR